MSTIYIYDKWGKKRKAEEVECAFCHKKVIRRIYTNRPNLFCSQKCSALSKKKSKLLKCAFCGDEFEVKNSRLKEKNFCCRKCKDLYNRHERHPRWSGGLATYRRRAIRKYGHHCVMGDSCLLKGINLPDFAYEVDHKDGNRDNNSIDNLQVLCILCHRKKTLGL